MLKNILSRKIDTKMFVGVVLFALVFAVTGVSVVEARQNNSDPVMALAQTNDNVVSRVSLPALTAATSTVLVDRSDLTNFKHLGSSSLEVSQIQVDWTADVVATTTLKFGVIASTTPAGNLVDVYWFDEVSFSTYNSTGSGFNGRQSVTLDYGNSVVKLSVASGIPTKILTNDSNTSSSLFATTTKNASPVGLASAGSGSFPNVGDLVMRVYDQKGTATTTVTTLYRNN